MRTTEEIDEADLVTGQVYEIHSRNLAIGVWNDELRTFTGVRQKFGDRYLFAEYHWNCGPPYGTARAVRALEGATVRDDDLDTIEQGLESVTKDHLLFRMLDALDRQVTRYRTLDWSLTEEWAVQYWDLTRRDGEPALVNHEVKSLHVAQGMHELYSRRTVDEEHHAPKIVTRRTTGWREVPGD